MEGLEDTSKKGFIKESLRGAPVCSQDWATLSPGQPPRASSPHPRHQGMSPDLNTKDNSSCPAAVTESWDSELPLGLLSPRLLKSGLS